MHVYYCTCSACTPFKCIYLVAIIGPGAKGKVALLTIKGEIRDVHLTGTLSDGRGVPSDLTIIPQHHIRVRGSGGVLLIRTEQKRNAEVNNSIFYALINQFEPVLYIS